MKLDNFTTARCSRCHWIKQFQPGKEYDAKEFKCNCKDIIEENTEVKVIRKKSGRPPNKTQRKGE